MKTFNEYQEKTKQTAIYPKQNNIGIYYTVLGLVGESGEIANKVKKIIRDNKKINEEYVQTLSLEIGDVMWYVSQLCNELELSLESVCNENIEKLLDRQKRDKIQGEGDNR